MDIKYKVAPTGKDTWGVEIIFTMSIDEASKHEDSLSTARFEAQKITEMLNPEYKDKERIGIFLESCTHSMGSVLLWDKYKHMEVIS